MLLSLRRLLFLLFSVSGFCAFLNQVLWVQRAFSLFGASASVLSVVLSAFALGLAIGIWGGGKIIAPLSRATRSSPVLFFGLTQLLLAFGALAVPFCLSLGATSVQNLVGGRPSSLLFSAVSLTLSLFPWSLLMGAAVPFLMAFVKRQETSKSPDFSFYYFAQGVGAAAGAGLGAFILLERLGTSGAQRFAAVGNFLVAMGSLWVASRFPASVLLPEAPPPPLPPLALRPKSARVIYALLFLMGFTSLAMEVVWTQAFTPFFKNRLYAFECLLTSFLVAAALGSQRYRSQKALGSVGGTDVCLGRLSVAAFFPFYLNNPRWHPNGFMALASLIPFCLVLGYLTPKLIDQISQGGAERAAHAYAWNLAGAVLGPLCAGYLLLPFLGTRDALLWLAVPYVALFIVYFSSFTMTVLRKWSFALASLLLLAISLLTKT